MRNTPTAAPSILIASDNATDASMVKGLLAGAFGNVFTCTDSAQAVEDFERLMPGVLVLAFDTLEKSERYCLGLDRRRGKIDSRPHRTVILCDKEEVRQVAELCIKQSFDDYVLFWPMNHDAQRLHMSVHHALRELSARNHEGPSVAEFAAQARRLSELQVLFDQHIASGGRRIENANLAIEQAGQDIDAALQGFSRRLGQGALQNGVQDLESAAIEQEVARLERDEIHPPLRLVAESMQALQHWVDEFRQECAPQAQAARAASAVVDRLRPTVLIVDDDDFQRKLLARILQAQNYELLFATSGAEALNSMRKTRPDIVLMDVLMPGMDGIETTRRLKAVPQFANLPVIMITGKSDGTVVADSLRAGAADFVVKPLDRDKLIAKLARWSRPEALS